MVFAVLVAWFAMFCMVCAGNPTTSNEFDEVSVLVNELICCKEKQLGYCHGKYNFDPLLARDSEQYQSQCLALGVEPTDFVWVNHQVDQELIRQYTQDWIAAMLWKVKACPVMQGHTFQMDLLYSFAISASEAGSNFWTVVQGMMLDQQLNTATVLVFPQF